MRLELDPRYRCLEAIIAKADWDGVHARYDRVRTWNPNRPTPLLNTVDDEGRTSDRSLYYWLRKRADAAHQSLAESLDLGWYSSLLYWKHYSGQGQQHFAKWHVKLSDPETAVDFRRLLHAVSSNPNRDPSAIATYLRTKIPKYNLPGMGFSSNAIPTMTTFLHVLYPDSVPIIDKMVLRCALHRGQDLELLDQEVQKANKSPYQNGTLIAE